MHRLLKRQLKKLYGEESPVLGEFQGFVNLVNDSYKQFQDDYNKLERILELSATESFKELNNFKNAINSAAIVSLANAKGDIIYANENFCQISKYKLNELVGRNHNILNSGHHPKSFWKNMWTCISKGEIWKAEICNLDKARNLYWVDSTVIPFLNENGKAYQYLSIRFDITSRKKIEEEINTLALVAQKTQNAVIITDYDGLAIWANEGFERITEYSVEDILGKKPGTLLQGKDSSPETIKEISKALKSKIPYNGEIYNYSKSGRGYWISLSITPMLDKDQHKGFIAIEADITERKLYEKKFKDNERLLQALNAAAAELLSNKNFNLAIGEAIQIVGKALDIDQVQVFENRAETSAKGSLFFDERFEWKKVDNVSIVNNPNMAGLDFSSLGLERWQKEFGLNRILKGFVKDFPEEEQKILLSSNINSIMAVPIFILDKFWGFISFDDCSKGLVWTKTEEQILRNFANNIGSAFERHYSELKIKENEEKFRLLIESATDIFYYTDYKGNFTYVNDIATPITGFSTAELLQMNYLDLVEPDQRSRVEKFYRKQSLSGKKVTYYEFPIKTKSGKTAWIGQNVQLIQNQDQTKGIQAIARDITSLKNAQFEIENSRNFLNEIIDAIPSPVFVKNRQHKWVLVNNAYSALTNIPKNEILGKTDLDFLPLTEAERFIELDEKQFIAKGETNREVNFINKDKENQTLLVKKSVFENYEKEYIICVITDISELLKAEEANRKVKEFYERVLNKIPSDVVVFDKDHRYLFVNEIAIRDPEKRAWMIGHNDYEYCAHFNRPISIADNRRKIFEQVAKERKQYEFEEELIKPDGTCFWMLRRFYPVIDEHGNINNIIGFGIDITIRKETEQKILKQQNDLEEAQHIAKVGGWELELSSKTIKWSKELFHICEFDTEMNPTLEEYYSMYTPETRKDIQQAYFEALEKRIPFELEAQIITKKNNVIDVRTKGVPLIENGIVTSIRGILQDITVEKYAKRQLEIYTEILEKKNRELDQFAYVVSHDLKAPLRGIENLSLWIEEDLGDDISTDTQTNLTLMRKRIKRMEGLIDGILQYSRAGRIKHEVSTYHLKEVIEDLISHMSPEEKFRFEIQDDLPEMVGEKIVIEQIFANYISNAIKYNNNANPVIQISYKIHDHFYEFCVADNGPGIEKEFHEKVFVIFQTLQSRDSFESTGVGLAIVKKMVEEKGGKVWIESEMGVGTQFFFSWPINESE